MSLRRRHATKSAPGGIELWQLAYLDAAKRDAKKFLDGTQYAHVVQQFERLAQEENPKSAAWLDIRPIEDFYELRDKGGVLGKINLRVYFAFVEQKRTILVLGADKKEQEGKTSTNIKVRMRNRLRYALSIL